MPQVADDLAWLDEATDRGGKGIEPGDSDQLCTLLRSDHLERMAGALPLPAALRELAARPDLHRRIPSVTACYLDLGDRRVRTVEGGSVLHILSDQQWACHWLLYVDDAGHEAVLTSSEPVGVDPFDEDADPQVVVDLYQGFAVAADTFLEFLVRFWLENELWLAITRREPLSPILGGYAAQLRSME